MKVFQAVAGLRRVIIAAALCAPVVLAQADKGSLLGTVTDSSQAPVPQATATYRVERERQGFKKAVRDNVRLEATVRYAWT